VYRDQLMAFGIVLGDPNSATKAFADLKTELDNEKITRKAAQIEVDPLARAVKDMKISADKFAAQTLLLKTRLNTSKTRRWMDLMKSRPENSA
jgi:hypothetical protein